MPVIIIIGTYLLLMTEYKYHPFKTTIFSSKYKTLDVVIFWRYLANITDIESRQSFYSYKTGISKRRLFQVMYNVMFKFHVSYKNWNDTGYFQKLLLQWYWIDSEIIAVIFFQPWLFSFFMWRKCMKKTTQSYNHYLSEMAWYKLIFLMKLITNLRMMSSSSESLIKASSILIL